VVEQIEDEAQVAEVIGGEGRFHAVCGEGPTSELHARVAHQTG
jgi:hypothetical protein